MDPTTVIGSGAIPGVTQLLNSRDVAISVMMVIIILQSGLVWYLLKSLMTMKDVMEKVNVTLSVLNERISHVAANQD